jgi:hypothetical protein
MGFRETGKWESAIDVANRVLASNPAKQKVRDEKTVYDQSVPVSNSPIRSPLFLMVFSVYVCLHMGVDYFNGLSSLYTVLQM